MEIKYKKIGELTPYTNNARTHSDEQVDQIVASIKEFGFTNPLLIDEKGEIIAGHGRLAAAKKLNMDEVPTIELKGLSEAQKRAYVIADNKLALNAGWDEELLKAEFEALQNLDFDLELTGFSEDELEEMGLLGDGIEINTDKADDVPEIDEYPIIKQGDLIELGHNYQHRLLCGDSTDEASVDRLMDGKKADMVFTDPHYGVSYQNNMTRKFNVLKNDDVFLDEWIKFLPKISKGFIFVWTSYQVLPKWMELLKPLGEMSNMIIWFKGGGGLGDLKGAFATDYEIALVFNRGAKLQGKRIGSVWDIKKDHTASYIHPTQKPVALAEQAIFNSSKTKQIVLDLFLGSGSTIIACENLSRQCYGMEIDEKYAQVIVQRYVDYTNNPKIKINGKEVDWYEYKEAANG